MSFASIFCFILGKSCLFPIFHCPRLKEVLDGLVTNVKSIVKELE